MIAKFARKVLCMEYPHSPNQRGGAVLRVFDEKGNPLSTYSDKDLCVLQENPVKANCKGFFPDVHLNPDDKQTCIIEVEDRFGNKMTIN